ncbi:TonB-dependent siderophore receptor [Croceicoccus sp. YJ47]|uniref:TonB-dependent siderophore receptor n=1 Tax=Croceicoccus sp. YJ47 TaxID=2798724 RepID=UPI0019219706|nr:TonB-dependent receptor [Croceicoccus sp. YJ47]QQN74387.1 TonB-dependent receptor [Croceicoccus sp. YJ47]
MKFRHALAFGVALSALSNPVFAQDEAVADQSAEDGEFDPMNVIVVTGATTGERSRFETTYAITVLDQDELNRRAPSAISDIIGTAPGLYVESSGGVIGNNVYSRGLPNDNYRYIPVLEDGLPVWEEGAGAFTNADIFYRVDQTIESAQIVRGGSASITASNAPGGVLNIVTKRTAPTLEGIAKVEWGDYDHFRGDFNLVGPISDDVSFHVGGFYRSDNGGRDPGFNGNRGGQFRAGLTYDDGENSLYVGYRKLADHAIFYTPMPLASTDEGLPGLSAQDGTLYNSDWRNFIVPNGNGDFETDVDLGDGVYTNTDTLTVLGESFLNDWLSINVKGRYTSGRVDYIGLFSNNVETVSDFQARALGSLQGADPLTTGVVFRNANTGNDIAASDIGNGLVLTESIFATFVDVENLIGDISFNGEFDRGSITVGYYYSNFDQRQLWNWNDVLVEALNRPRLLDVVGQDASGNDTVALTLNGLSNLHGNLQLFTDHVEINALYATGSFDVTDALRVDAGLRYHMVTKAGTIARTNSIDLGNPDTIVDDNVAVFSGGVTPYNFDTDQLAFSLGANYEFNPDFAAFARYSRSFRVTPEFQQWFNCCGNVEDDIELLEGGLKYSRPGIGAFVTLFYNNFPNIAFSNIGANGQVESATAAARSYGVEVELNWQPADIFDIAVSGSLQDISYTGFSGTDANGPFDFSGNQIRRQPEYTASIRPTLHLLDEKLDIFANAQFIGRRYEDVANTVELPAYTVIDLGADLAVTDRISLQAMVTNLFDEVGITEGNPRAGAISNTGGPIFQGRPIFGRQIRVGATVSF